MHQVSLLCQPKNRQNDTFNSTVDDRGIFNILHDVEYEAFKATYVARKLYENDDEWQQCLRKASMMQNGAHLRYLFVKTLIHGPSAVCDDYETNIASMRLTTVPTSFVNVQIQIRQ